MNYTVFCMNCFVENRKKVDRNLSSQLNTKNRENSMEMNSNYESLRTNQSSRTVVYDVLALDQKSSAPDHPRSDPMYDEINEDYTKPELYT